MAVCTCRTACVAALISFSAGIWVSYFVGFSRGNSGNAPAGLYERELADPGASDGPDCNPKPCSPCPSRVTHGKCRWKFVKHIPSDLEALWRERGQMKRRIAISPCNPMDTEFRDYFRRYLDACDDPTNEGHCAFNRVLEPGNCSCAAGEKPKTFDPGVFSRFEYINECTNEVIHSFIEPLGGIMRHPKVCTLPSIPEHKRRAGGSDTSYLVLDQWEVHKNRGPRSRTFYFDLGASTWAVPEGRHPDVKQPWFYSTYEHMCAAFQGVWAWEVTPSDPGQTFASLPKELVPNYHWYNIPADDTIGAKNNPLTHIRNVATVDDYVILKIDIDTAPVEEAFVEQLLADEELLGLVDEFFWEHHVRLWPIQLSWKKSISKVYSALQSQALFAKLREAGIRAHSWV